MSETSESQASDLAAALEMVRRPPVMPRMPPASLPVRLKTSPGLRRLVPTRLVVQRAERRGQAIWENNPNAREEAEAVMETVVAGTRLAHAVGELARLHLIEASANHALFWQPWPPPRVDPESAERLREALSAGRGVLASSCHLGPDHPTSAVFAPLGHVSYAVAGAWYFEEPSPDYWGRRQARWRKGSHARPVLAKGSFALLKALLEQGETVGNKFDMPGRCETHFLGKTAMLTDGSARLAAQADALILPLRMRRRGHTLWTDFAPALDPRDFSDAKELHDMLATHHERWILEFPAAMENPNSFGWAGAATARGWMRPELA